LHNNSPRITKSNQPLQKYKNDNKRKSRSQYLFLYFLTSLKFIGGLQGLFPLNEQLAQKTMNTGIILHDTFTNNDIKAHFA
jgi:hypothetical protein